MEKEYTVTDKQLSISYANYLQTGDRTGLRNDAAMWMHKMTRRMNAGDDECSAAVLRFLENFEKYLDLFSKGQYPYFPSFMNTVTRNLVLNEKKMARKRISEAYLSLWSDKNRRLNPEKEPIGHITPGVLQEIMSLQSNERLIVKLRHSLDLGYEDSLYIRDYCRDKGLCYAEFMQRYREKKQRKEELKNSLLVRMNNYNKKIVLWQKPGYKQQKKNLFERIDRLNNLYSFNELGSFMGIAPRQVSCIYHKAIRGIEKKLSAAI